ncbi:BRO family protein [Chromobacterium amazonense]|uniref:BRO-N domain-containing protein n=1 Tax=Chromobacterium amazonense TaxID=1382803 RepID=UPI00237D7EAD|nr:BRO family protein [Chromobacterium amazonense]MDE1715802.1 BRO family protein [Chromobacterium amazonense]
MSKLTQGVFAPAVFDFQSICIRAFADERGEPWFCAADICAVLGYRNARDAISKHCREGGVAKRDTPTESGIQPLTFINEGNLYRLIIKSRKPEAETFERKVMEEILPSIRKTGRYDAAAPAPAASGARGDIPFVLNHFENEDGHSLTASLDELGVMWVCAGMLGDMLGLENTLALVQAHCRPEGVRMWMDQQVFVDEMNTHRLLARSGSSAADHVSDWLAHEVLPALRQASFDRLAGLNPDDAQQVERLSAPQYMKQAREALMEYIQQLAEQPRGRGNQVSRALPELTQAAVDGMLATILQRSRWILSFDRDMTASMQQVPMGVSLVETRQHADLARLASEVPVELLPVLISECAARLGSAAARRG